jgi:hypothetical protein
MIKVSKKTLKKLHKLAGKLTQERGERVTLEDAILYIFNAYKKKGTKESDLLQIQNDRESLLSLLQNKVKGAGPSDFMEYDYDDIGGINI